MIVEDETDDVLSGCSGAVVASDLGTFVENRLEEEVFPHLPKSGSPLPSSGSPPDTIPVSKCPMAARTGDGLEPRTLIVYLFVFCPTMWSDGCRDDQLA